MSRVNPQKEGVLGECQDREAYCCSYRITRSGGPNPAWFRLVLSQVGGIGNRLIKLDLKLSNHSVLDCLRAKSFNHHFCCRIKPGHHDTIRKFTILDLDGHYVLYRFDARTHRLRLHAPRRRLLCCPSGSRTEQPVSTAVQLFGSYSSMGVSLSEVSTGTVYISETYTQYDTVIQGTTDAQEVYNVLYASPTTYKVDISESQGQSLLNATAWVLKNGTAVAYSYLGQNITGSEATGLYEGLMTPFFTETQYSLLAQTLTTAVGVHSSDQGAVQIGLTTVRADELYRGAGPTHNPDLRGQRHAAASSSRSGPCTAPRFRS